MDMTWISLLMLALAWTGAVHIYEPPTPLWLAFGLAGLAFGFAAFRRRGGLGLAESARRALGQCAVVLLAQGAVFPFYYIFAARNHAEGVFAPIAGAILNLFGMKAVSEGSYLYIDAFLRTVTFSSSWEKVGAVHFLLFGAGAVAVLALRKSRAWRYAAFFAMTFAYAAARYAFLIMIYATYPYHSIFWERAITLASLVPYALLLAAAFRGLPLAGVEWGGGLPRRRPAAAAAATTATAATAAATVAAAVTASLALLLGASFALFFGLRDYGREKQGRVLVDEYHSDWEWTTDAYDEQWFGERSGYNYYCFYNYLDKFYETDRNMGPVSADALRGADVFIMKTPTVPFEGEEIRLLADFVENGGGLYLIGDHTNVFGTDSNLNQISEQFGLRFNYDCTYELVNGNLSEYDAPRLMPHQAVFGLPHFLFATSDTLSAKWQAEEVIIGYGLKNLQADYSQMNFFPADTNAATLEFGLFLQSAGVAHGKGRVLAFTDSTVFSNFWMFMPGKPELLLGSVEWLNSENAFPGGMAPREAAAALLLLSAIACAAWPAVRKKAFLPARPHAPAPPASALAPAPAHAPQLAPAPSAAPSPSPQLAPALSPAPARQSPPPSALQPSPASSPTSALQSAPAPSSPASALAPAPAPPFPLALFVLAAIAGALLGAGFCHAASAVASRPPDPVKPMVDICFEREYSRFMLPDAQEGFMANMDEQLNTFYVWTQRLDYFPSVKSNLASALRDGDLAVMAKPGRALRNPGKTLDAVRQGAKLLVLDNMASGGFSNSLLKLAGMELVGVEPASSGAGA
ncbi:MAG: GldG family protein, partial [Clostridiales bacterium]|nr:GldG family protein [Clostridiales bacterium]